MFKAFNDLPDIYQGIIYIIAGLTVLLYALGFIETGITLIIILFGCYLISIGAVKSGLYNKVTHMVNKHTRK